MSNRCPPEILDGIVDLLHDNIEVLKQCCLVSKSWVPRSRKYLFVVIKFRTPGDLERWKEIFPDPSNSPAHHTRTLSIHCLEAVTTADAEEGSWIQAFACLTHLEVDDSSLSLVWFVLCRKFSSTLKSLHIALPALVLPQLFHLIHSFPLLEDLTLRGDTAHDYATRTAISLPPSLTGTLDIFVYHGIASSAHRLLNLSNGLRFQKLKLGRWEERELHLVTGLVEACSDTLGCLDITVDLEGAACSISLLDRSITRASICSVWVQSSDRPLQSDEAERCRVSV